MGTEIIREEYTLLMHIENVCRVSYGYIRCEYTLYFKGMSTVHVYFHKICYVKTIPHEHITSHHTIHKIDTAFYHTTMRTNVPLEYPSRSERNANNTPTCAGMRDDHFAFMSLRRSVAIFFSVAYVIEFVQSYTVFHIFGQNVSEFPECSWQKHAETLLKVVVPRIVSFMCLKFLYIRRNM